MTEVATTQAPGTSPEEKSGFKLIWLLYIISGIVLLSVFAFIVFQPVQVLPRITLGPGYALTDQDGNRLTNEDVRGSIVLYNIMYTNCDVPCTEMSQTMQEVQARLDEVDTGGIPIRFVSISIDPEHDTPDVLKTYAESFNADPEQWYFVTGAVDRLKWIVGGGFGLYFDKKDAETMVFDPGYFLIDSIGIMRAEYRTATPGADRILRDIGLITKEIQNSSGATRYAYEAAHLFLCYPRG